MLWKSMGRCFQLVIVEQIATRHTASSNHIRQSCAFDCGYRLKLFAADVVEEHGPLFPACAPCVFVRLGVDMAVRHQQVFPPVIVVVNESVAPAEEGNRDLSRSEEHT